MRLRALRVVALATAFDQPWTNSLSFASTLQLAAGRAWTRRITACAPMGRRMASSSKRKFNSPSTIVTEEQWKDSDNPIVHSTSSSGITARGQHSKILPAPSRPLYNWREFLQRDNSVGQPKPKKRSRTSLNPRRNRRQQVEGVPVTYFDPTVSDHEPTDAETGLPDEDNIDLFQEIPPETRAEFLPTVHDAIPGPGAHLLISPTSRTSLYQNLLYLINVRKPTASLPSLVDYHFHYPQWQSTRSYNLLIDLSLRHWQYGITAHLFRSQRRSAVPLNTESHQLIVRSLVQQNIWDEAWNYVRTLIKQNLLPRDKNGREVIPFSIWLEFCRAPKKRRKPSHDTGLSPTLEEQYEILQDVKPANIPPLQETSPFAIFCLVDLMLRSGRQNAAVALTEAYFKALPKILTKKWVLGCLKVIHVHIARCTEKPGLPKFYKARRILFSFLRLHRSLKPNGKTLCLLFKALQRAKSCGRIAWTQLYQFKKDWGPQVENRRVLRRVSQLALKEGRMDITRKIRDIESASRLCRQRRLREETLVDRLRSDARGLRRRLPYRLIYPRNGREAQRWYRHRARIRQKIWRLSMKTLFRQSGSA